MSQARSWKLNELEGWQALNGNAFLPGAMTKFFELRRRLCPQTPILVPLNELRLHSVQTQQSSTPEQIRLHLKEVG